MYIKYDGKIYYHSYPNIANKRYAITHNIEKLTEGFEKQYDYYKKIVCDDDPNIQDVYDIDFYVDYVDEKQTMKLMRDVTRWCVNDNRPCYQQPEIEKDELGIQGMGMNDTDGWKTYDRGASSKIIHLSDCTGFIVKYTYTVKDGCKLTEELIEEVNMTSEEFKNEMIRHNGMKI